MGLVVGIAVEASWTVFPLCLGYWLEDWRALLGAVVPPLVLYATTTGGPGTNDFLVFGLIIMLVVAVLFTCLGVLARHVREARWRRT
jgi:hypothetical protein